MTDAHNYPRARERNRGGVRHLDWTTVPSPDEAAIDKVVLRMTGAVVSPSADAMLSYGNALSENVLEYGRRLFGAGHWAGNKFIMPVLSNNGSSIGAGSVHLHRRGADAGIDVSLTLNPTRTLSNLLDRHAPGAFDELAPRAFFGLTASPRARAATLDRRDNMVVNFDTVGGTVFHARVRQLDLFLGTYERQLRRLLIDLLCPPQQGYQYSDDGGDVVGRNGDHEVRLNWGRISLIQCEVYWERTVPSALGFMRTFADRVLSSARDVRVQTYDLPAGIALERAEASLAVTMPLVPSASIVLAVYAKALQRVRFEVRYLKSLPQPIRDDATHGLDRIQSLFRAVRTHAATKLPWPGLAQLMAQAPRPHAGELIELAVCVMAAVGHDGARCQAVLEALLLTGGVSATEPDGMAPEALLRALEVQGVVRRVILQSREPRDGGRRYGLSPRFDAVRTAALAGFGADTR